MTQSIVLFYGTPGHQTLELLYQHIRERGRRRAVFIAQERFPRDVGLQLGAGRQDATGYLLPPHEEPIPLDEVCGVCLDGFHVSERSLDDVEPADLTYATTETWATLIALFARLARQCVVANHITRRDAMRSRSARLAFLASCGLGVPPLLVTSHPGAAREFYQFHGSRTYYQPLYLQVPQLKPMLPSDLERLETLREAPMHFEADPPGRAAHYVKVGSQFLGLMPRTTVPAKVLDGCMDAARRLDLELAEFTLREVGGHWIVVDLHPHVTVAALAVPEVLEAAVALLEGDRA